MHIFCLDYTVSVSKSYPLRVQNKLTTSAVVRGSLSLPCEGEVARQGRRGSSPGDVSASPFPNDER